MTMPRETGSEKATSAVCAICGGPVPVLESPYGSTSPGTCPKCYPSTDRQQAQAAPSVPREIGTSIPAAVPTAVEGGA